MDWILPRSDSLKLQLCIIYLLLLQTYFCFIRHYLIDWSCVDYCDVFIDCSHSDGTHSLQRTN